MDNNEKILCEASIKYKITVTAIIFWILWYSVVLFCIEPLCRENWGQSIIGTVQVHIEYIKFRSPFMSYPLLILYLAIFIIAYFTPLMCICISRLFAQNCTLTLTEKQICGQLKTLFGKKQIQIPIEKLDNIMTSSGFMDKLRSGETICVSSNSGMVKFHYVQNADEFVQAALKRIEEVKRSQPTTAPQAAPVQHAQPAPVQNVSGSDAMEKINSLRQMLDSGLISQEEFDEKKKDILSKM